jgi:two-component system response regulator MprA
MTTTIEMPVAEPIAKSARKKVLLVDDDPAIRQILVRLLAEENFLVLTAANGVEALALNDAAEFDLVLLDLNMPIKDGWSTLEQLTVDSPTLPIIVITARPNQFLPALTSGVGALLEKPLDFTKLFQTIHGLLAEAEEMRLARPAKRSTAFNYVPSADGRKAGNSF